VIEPINPSDSKYPCLLVFIATNSKMLYRFISAASLISLASAANFNVAVGPGLTYSPNTITGAAKGDTVTFSFAGVHDGG
jgi:hypothetical protein